MPSEKEVAPPRATCIGIALEGWKCQAANTRRALLQSDATRSVLTKVT